MKGVMEITTKDLDSGKRFVVTTYYDEKYTISKEGIAFDSPFTFRPDENFEGDVKIIRCRVGSWLQAKIK